MPVFRCQACKLYSGGKPVTPGDGKVKSHKCRILNVKIQFKESEFTENYEMKINTGQTVAELKGDIELLTGIPTVLQQVCFNDEAILYDTTVLHELNLVSNCTFSLTVRHDWAKLVEAVLQQDFDKLMSLGITEDSDFRSPSLDYITDPVRRKEALRFRATVALIIASHRGMTRLVKQLVAAGIDVNGQTQFKRCALHIVAAKGQAEILDLLIHNGANIDLVDYNNETALDIANRLEQQQSARQLFLFRWQQRAKNAQPSFADIPLFPHQYFDSDLTIHFNGNQGQVYMMHVPPPGEGDRWKPRKIPEIVCGISPTRTTAGNEPVQQATGTVSENDNALPSKGVRKAPVATDYFTSAVFGGNKPRSKSPSFAFEDGIAVVGTKKEGKITFEEWLAQKKSGPTRVPSGFGTREGLQNQRQALSSATAASTPTRLMSANQELQHRHDDSAVTSKTAGPNRLNMEDKPTLLKSADNPSANHHVPVPSEKTKLPRQTHHRGFRPASTFTTAPSMSHATFSKDSLDYRNASTPQPRSTTSIPTVPIHDLIYKYIRVQSPADGWVKHDRDKSGMTSLWA